MENFFKKTSEIANYVCQKLKTNAEMLNITKGENALK